MKKKIMINVNHDGPEIYDLNGDLLFIMDLEKELGVDDMLDDENCFPVWIDPDDFKNCDKGER